MAFCENCGTKILEGFLFCAECGTPVPQEETPVVLPQETAPVVVEASAPVEAPIVVEEPAPVAAPVVVEQSAPVQAPVVAEQPPVAPPPVAPMVEPIPKKGKAKKAPKEKTKKKSAKGIIIAIIALLVVAGGTFGYHMAMDSKYAPDVIETKFLEALELGDTDAILELTTSELTLDETTLAPMLALYKANPVFVSAVTAELEADREALMAGESVDEEGLLYIEEVGEFLYTNHKVVLLPQEAYIPTNLEATFTLNGESLDVLDEDPNAKKEETTTTEDTVAEDAVAEEVLTPDFGDSFLYLESRTYDNNGEYYVAMSDMLPGLYAVSGTFQDLTTDALIPLGGMIPETLDFDYDNWKIYNPTRNHLPAEIYVDDVLVEEIFCDESCTLEYVSPTTSITAFFNLENGTSCEAIYDSSTETFNTASIYSSITVKNGSSIPLTISKNGGSKVVIPAEDSLEMEALLADDALVLDDRMDAAYLGDIPLDWVDGETYTITEEDFTILDLDQIPDLVNVDVSRIAEIVNIFDPATEDWEQYRDAINEPYFKDFTDDCNTILQDMDRIWENDPDDIWTYQITGVSIHDLKVKPLTLSKDFALFTISMKLDVSIYSNYDNQPLEETNTYDIETKVTYEYEDGAWKLPVQ